MLPERFVARSQADVSVFCAEPPEKSIAMRELVAFDRTHEGMALRMVCHTQETLRAYQVDWNMFYQETKPHEE